MELQIKQTLPREGSDIQHILLPFLFKDFTDFTHTCREQRLNLQPEVFSIWHTYKLLFDLWLQLLLVEPVTIGISVFKLWSAKKPLLKKFPNSILLLSKLVSAAVFPSIPQICHVIWSYALVHPLEYFLCHPCLWLCQKAHPTKDAWVAFCHCISANVSSEHCFNAHRPTGIQNLSSGSPLLLFHIKHDSDSDNGTMR